MAQNPAFCDSQESLATIESVGAEWEKKEKNTVKHSSTDSSSDDHFDVYDRKHVRHPTSNLDTLFHLLKGNVGTGVLAMPDAFRNAGWLIGTIGTAFIGFVAIHCMNTLVNCSRILSERHKKVHLSFAQAGELAFKSGPKCLRKFSKFSRILINSFVCITQLGFCCVYFVFIADNIKQVIDMYLMELDARLYMLIILIPIILLCWVRDLKHLAPCSVVANTFMIIGIIIIMYYVLQDPIPLKDLEMAGSWSTLPLYFGTTVYTFEGISLVIPLENEMRTPQAFTGCAGVLNTGMTIAACIYIGVGFFGYLKYGSGTLGSVTLNLPKDPLAQSVSLMIAVSVFLTYSLQFYVPISNMWPAIKKKISNPKKHVRYEILFRTAFVLLTFVLAEAIPELGLFISLVGAVGASVLSLILPPIVECLTYWEIEGGYGRFKWRLWKNIFIVCFGMLGFITGTYSSIAAIIDSFTGGGEETMTTAVL